MNSSKTEFIVFGYRSQLEKCCVNNIRVNNDDIPRTGVIKYLGAHLDQHLNMKYHIQSKCNAAMLNLLRLKNIRPYLTASACTTLVLGTVISHLDFVNSLFSCLPNCYVRKLQRIQNMAAKLILLKSRRDSATACLKTLHWLPVHLRVEFKVLVLVFKCVTNQAPNTLWNF